MYIVELVDYLKLTEPLTIKVINYNFICLLSFEKLFENW